MTKREDVKYFRFRHKKKKKSPEEKRNFQIIK